MKFQTIRTKNQELLLWEPFLNWSAGYPVNKSSWFFVRIVWNFTWTPHLPFGNFYIQQTFWPGKNFTNRVVKTWFLARKKGQNGGHFWRNQPELKEFVSSGPNDTQKAEGHLSKVGGTPPLSRFCEKLSWNRFINKNFQMAQFLSMGLLVGQVWWLHTENEPSQHETERATALWKLAKNDPKWRSKLWLLLQGPWGLWSKGPLWYFDTPGGGLSENEWISVSSWESSGQIPAPLQTATVNSAYPICLACSSARCCFKIFFSKRLYVGCSHPTIGND